METDSGPTPDDSDEGNADQGSGNSARRLTVEVGIHASEASRWQLRSGYKIEVAIDFAHPRR